MPDSPATLQSRLEAWRAQGADRVDPLRFALMAALAQRAASHQGMLRQRLDARLAQLADGYAQRLAAPSISVTPVVDTAPGRLRGLLEHIGNAASATLPEPVADPTTAVSATSREAAAAPVLEPLAALDEFQQLWGRIRIDSLLRQSQESISEEAGPLHSSVLLHRAMNLMRDISPAYLQHFLAYSDALSWLEQLHAGGSTQAAESGRATTARKVSRTATPRRRKSPAATAEQVADKPAE